MHGGRVTGTDNNRKNWSRILESFDASIMMQSIRKLNTGDFNFQWTKTLYKNILSHITFFFTLFKIYICSKLCKISPTKRFLWVPRKINFRFHLVKSEAFEVSFLELPRNLFFGVILYNLLR